MVLDSGPPIILRLSSANLRVLQAAMDLLPSTMENRTLARQLESAALPLNGSYLPSPSHSAASTPRPPDAWDKEFDEELLLLVEGRNSRVEKDGNFWDSGDSLYSDDSYSDDSDSDTAEPPTCQPPSPATSSALDTDLDAELLSLATREGDNSTVKRKRGPSQPPTSTAKCRRGGKRLRKRRKTMVGPSATEENRWVSVPEFSHCVNHSAHSFVAQLAAASTDKLAHWATEFKKRWEQSELVPGNTLAATILRCQGISGDNFAMMLDRIRLLFKCQR